MSLVRNSWIALAAAATVFIVTPWWLVRSHGAAHEDQGPLPAPHIMAIHWPALPVAALGGRLFFGQIGQVADAQNMSTADMANATPPPPPPPPAPTLVGTVISRTGRTVAILRLTSGTSQVVTSGDVIEGWHVTAIANGHATVTRDGRSDHLAVATPTVASNSNEPRGQ